jgi:hypothetical protein
VKLPEKETVIRTKFGNGVGIAVTDQAIYELSSKRCVRKNFEKLSSGSHGYNFLKYAATAERCLDELLQRRRAQEEAVRLEIAKKERAEKRAQMEAEEREREESQKNQIESMLAWDDSVAKSRAKAMSGKTIVFKTLYVGMPIEDALRILFKRMNDHGRADIVYPQVITAFEAYRMLEANNLTDGCLVQDFARVIQENAESQVVVISSFSIGRGIALHSFVSADSSGEVNKICMDAGLINILFDSADLDAAQFVERFKSAYNIPLEMTNVWPQEWSYTAASGAKLTIDDNKTLRLEKVASESERKATFD